MAVVIRWILLAALLLTIAGNAALAQTGCPHPGYTQAQVLAQLPDNTAGLISPANARDIACNAPNLSQNLADIPSPSTALANLGGNNASNLTSGTLPDARLSGNIPRLNQNQQYTAGQAVAPFALTDAATIAVDCTKANDFTVTLAGNRTLGNFTGCFAGQTLNFYLTQDGTGSRTLAYASQYKFAAATAPVLSTGAGKSDFLSCRTVTTALAVCAALIADYR